MLHTKWEMPLKVYSTVRLDVMSYSVSPIHASVSSPRLFYLCACFPETENSSGVSTLPGMKYTVMSCPISNWISLILRSPQQLRTTNRWNVDIYNKAAFWICFDNIFCGQYDICCGEQWINQIAYNGLGRKKWEQSGLPKDVTQMVIDRFTPQPPNYK